MSTNHLLRIRTPEGIVFSQVLAGPMTRTMAFAVDFVCIIVLMTVLQKVFSVLDLLSPGIGFALLLVAYFTVSIGYFIGCEWWWRGQTIGKRLLHLRVVDAEGFRLQFHQLVIRNLLRFVDMLPMLYFLGGLVCWFNRNCQRLGDIAANTIVIRQPEVTEPDLKQLLDGKFNSLRLYPHLAARLRQLVSPAEAAVALQAVLRRDEFDPNARVKLFLDLAQHFSAKVDFPAEAIDGTTPEQFIRNVVDVIYRPRLGSTRDAFASTARI